MTDKKLRELISQQMKNYKGTISTEQIVEIIRPHFIINMQELLEEELKKEADKLLKEYAKKQVSSWQPNPEQDTEPILDELWDYYVGMIDACGDEEEAADALKMYAKVRLNGIIACQSDIEAYFQEIRDCLPENYFPEIFKDKERLAYVAGKIFNTNEFN